MADPYRVLGLPPDSTDEVIRRQYLTLVRAHTPERAPERFAAIREAYEKLREQIRRDYAGNYVGIAEGRLIAVAPSFNEVRAAIENLKPEPEYFLIFPADEEPPFEPYDNL